MTAAPGSPGVDRLTGSDLSGFVAERLGRPADIGVIGILDGVGLFDADGHLRISAVRDRVAGRLELVPRLRQVVYRPGWGLGRPVWVDARSFDITDHVRVRPLASGAGQPELLETCARLRRAALDPFRPMWQLWLLPGLSGGQVGLFIRLHHSIADGPAGVVILDQLLNSRPDSPPQPGLPWQPGVVPSSSDLVLDQARRIVAVLARTGRRIRHLRCGRRPVNGTRVRAALRELRSPRTSLNRPPGSVLRFAVITASLSVLKPAAQAARATINDVVLSAVAGGLRDLLQSRGENVAGVTLHAMVPVTMQDRSPGAARGNRYGAMLVPLPIGWPSAAQRLTFIARQTSERKKQPRALWGGGLLGSPLIQLLGLKLADRQHVISIHVANVRGPTRPLYLGEARLLSLFPVVPLSGNVTVGIGVLSYAGQVTIGVVADRECCPDLATFTTGLSAALSELTEQASAEGSGPA